MASTITLYASGTQTCTVGTEHFLSSPNASGFYQLAVDLVNAAALDLFELRTYAIILTAGTVRVEEFVQYLDAQATDDLIKRSIPIPNDLTDTNSVRFSIKQVAGTGRNVPYKVLQW